MKDAIYTDRQIVEIFHIEFLRQFIMKLDRNYYALKGGGNLRLFHQSIRYSEDMDLDINRERVSVDKLKKTVMGILEAHSFMSILKTYAIDGLVLPNMKTAKQTTTTQRFKVQLRRRSGIDLPTKIEFSGRGLEGNVAVEPVPPPILRPYRMASMVVPHYDLDSAVLQKMVVLAERAQLQARDIFDLHLLSSQYTHKDGNVLKRETIKKARERIFMVTFTEFKDVVVSYLSPEDQKIYDSERMWEDIQLKTEKFLEEYENGQN